MQDDPASGREIDDPHDDSFADAPEDPEFLNERCWERDGSMRRGQPTAFQSSDDQPPGEPRFLVDWIDGHREAKQPADPTYPNGCAIDVAMDAPRACRLELPCPAPRCGLFVITCKQCGYAIAIATAGRADDPKSVRLPCRPH